MNNISGSYDVIIAGAGFSGTLTLANLVSRLDKPAKILVADDTPYLFRGTAYSTERPEHLLNVRAKGMGAYPDDIGNFYKWLSARGYKYAEDDFVPRMIYGEYLCDIGHQAIELAATKNITLEFAKSTVVRTEKKNGVIEVELRNGEKAECRSLVLATGNKVGDASSPADITPWYYNFATLKKYESDRPVVVVGSGLTAVDTIISIFESGYAGEVLCISRKVLFPLSHTAAGGDKPLDISAHEAELLKARPGGVLKLLKKLVRNHKELNWHSVLDGMRPYNQRIWQGFDKRDQLRVMTRYGLLWNVHRHRMAPQIAARIEELRESGGLRTIEGFCSIPERGRVEINAAGSVMEVLADHIFDCRGLSLRVVDDVFKTVEGVKYAENGFGILGDKDFVINGDKAAPIYAIGSCFAGQLFETVAIPELRVQAAKVAESIAAML